MTAPREHLIVAVDARTVFDEPRRGIGKTTAALYRALALARPHWQFHLFHRDGQAGNPFADLSNVVPSRIDMPGDRFHLWPRIRLPLATALVKADVFHAPAGLSPPIPTAPLVATIHDLIPFDLRAADPDAIRWGAAVARTAKKARVIITASEHAKSRIVQYLGVPPSKVAVVRWGITSPVVPAGNPAVPERYGIPGGGQFVLHFGMADPRKNTARVIEAWSLLPEAVRRERRLLVIGLNGSGLTDFTKQVSDRNVSDTVRLFGYVPDDDANHLLKLATVLCYPTLYEGFGLPILDGFAAGVPVLTGNNSSLPEVAGNAAHIVEAESVQSIAAGLQELLSNPAKRAELIARGTERLALFNWPECAEQVARVFEATACRRVWIPNGTVAVPAWT